MTALVYHSPLCATPAFEQAMQQRWARLSDDQVQRHIDKEPFLNNFPPLPQGDRPIIPLR